MTSWRDPRMTFNAAQLKAVCVEASLLALRRDGTEVSHEDFNDGDHRGAGQEEE